MFNFTALDTNILREIYGNGKPSCQRLKHMCWRVVKNDNYVLISQNID
jgi:hypothetical protein